MRIASVTKAAVSLVALVLASLAIAAPASAIGPPCTKEFHTECFGLESIAAALSTTQAGAHPDVTFSFSVAQNPEGTADGKGTHDVYSPIRNGRIDAPPGLIGNPDVLGVPQQCTTLDLGEFHCPNGSQIGIAEADIYNFTNIVKEPLYMMAPPGGDVVARIGFIALYLPIYVDITVRSNGDFGLRSEISDAPAEANLVKAATTLWGVPSAK